MVYAAVGIKCPECARLPRTARVQLKPQRLARTLAAVLVGGLAMGIGIAYLQAVGIFFALIIGYLVGVAMAEIVLWGSGRFRAPLMAAIAAGGAVFTYVVPYLLYFGADIGAVASTLQRSPFVVLGAIIAAVVAYRRTL